MSDPEGNAVIIDEICEYVEKKKVKEILQEYMKRLIIEKPADPIKYLIKSISENPYIPPVEPVVDAEVADTVVEE